MRRGRGPSVTLYERTRIPARLDYSGIVPRRKSMRGPPSPASLWWCTAGSVAAGTPVAFRAESISSRNDDDGAGDARRDCASVTARNRACVPASLSVSLAAGVRTRKSTHTRMAGATRTLPPTSLCRGGECAYVRVKSGPPIDSEQLRAGLDRPVSPFLLPPARPRVVALSPLPALRVCCLCMHSQDERTPATRRVVLSRCVPFLLFRDIPLSIFYQTAYLDIRLSICRPGSSVSLCFTWITICDEKQYHSAPYLDPLLSSFISKLAVINLLIPINSTTIFHNN